MTPRQERQAREPKTHAPKYANWRGPVGTALCGHFMNTAWFIRRPDEPVTCRRCVKAIAAKEAK